MQVLKSIRVSVQAGISRSHDVLWVSGNIQNRRIESIGDLRDTTSNVTVKIERNSPVRYSLVAAGINVLELVEVAFSLNSHAVLGTDYDEAFSCQNCLDPFK